MTGGAGFARDSKSNYEKNLGYLDKFNASHFKRTHYKITRKRLYSYKEATPEQLEQIKERIRKEKNLYRKRSRVLLTILIILGGIALFSLFV